MFFQLYLENLPSYKEEIQDRLSRDNSNQTLKDFLMLIQAILKDYYSTAPASASETETLIKNIQLMNNEEILAYGSQHPEMKEQLEYYILNRHSITMLHTYIQSSSKVKNIARDFFNKDPH